MRDNFAFEEGEALIGLSVPSTRGDQNDETLVVGNLSLDLRNYQTRVDGKLLELSYQEFELLHLLAGALNHVLSYDLITEKLWGINGHTASRRLNVMVHRLRAKLVGMGPYVLHTVRGRGYGIVLM